MHLISKKRNKNAFALSMELIVTMVILIFIVAVVALGIENMQKKSRIQEVTNEYTGYKDSIIKFYNTFTFWPGDVSFEVLNDEIPFKANLNRAQRDIMDIISIREGTDPKESNTIYNSYYSEYYPQTGVVGNLKSMIAFRQLQIAGFITDDTVNVDTDIANKNGATSVSISTVPPIAGNKFGMWQDSMWPRADFAVEKSLISGTLISNRYLPIAKFNKNLAWQILLTPSNLTDCILTPASCNSDYYSKYNKTVNHALSPRLVLFQYTDLDRSTVANTSSSCKNLTTAAKIYAPTVYGINPVSYNNNCAVTTDGYGMAPVTPVAAVSAKFANELDVAIDDGQPMGESSFLTASDIEQYGTLGEPKASIYGCTSSGADFKAAKAGSVSSLANLKITTTTGATPVTTNPFATLRYQENATVSSYAGCVLFFNINYPQRRSDQVVGLTNS